MTERFKMPDFLGSDQEDQDMDQPETIEIGGESYTQEELDSLVGLGKIAREAEDRFDTKIDKVWPDYSRTKNELKTAQEKLEDMQRRYEEAMKPKAPQQDISIEDEVQRKQALKAAKEIGILTKEDLSELGLVSKQDIQNVIQEQLEVNNMVKEASRLEKELDGSDGRPAFDAVEVTGFMQDTGIKNLMTAYKVMHEDKLDEWKQKKIASKKGGMNTIDKSRAGTTREPAPIKVTRDNLGDMIKKGLAGELE